MPRRCGTRAKDPVSSASAGRSLAMRLHCCRPCSRCCPRCTRRARPVRPSSATASTNGMLERETSSQTRSAPACVGLCVPVQRKFRPPNAHAVGWGVGWDALLGQRSPDHHLDFGVAGGSSEYETSVVASCRRLCRVTNAISARSKFRSGSNDTTYLVPRSLSSSNIFGSNERINYY